jgi:DNA-binding transcriptional ArsR family regulator
MSPPPPIRPPAVEDAAAKEARARALSSPLRLRILRICLHEAHTNKEIADVLGSNPGTVLHHVRTLVATGLLAAGDPRPGRRGAREVPYRATGLSFYSPPPNASTLMVETFLQEVEGIDPEELDAWRLGVKLAPSAAAEFRARFQDLVVEYAEREPDPDGVALSLFVAIHPERQPRLQDGGQSPLREDG